MTSTLVRRKSGCVILQWGLHSEMCIRVKSYNTIIGALILYML